MMEWLKSVSTNVYYFPSTVILDENDLSYEQRKNHDDIYNTWSLVLFRHLLNNRVTKRELTSICEIETEIGNK